MYLPPVDLEPGSWEYNIAFVANEEMTNATGLQHLLKNVGGAIGTSTVGINVSTYAQIHQTYFLIG